MTFYLFITFIVGIIVGMVIMHYKMLIDWEKDIQERESRHGSGSNKPSS